MVPYQLVHDLGRWAFSACLTAVLSSGCAPSADNISDGGQSAADGVTIELSEFESQLALLECGNGQIAVWDRTEWICANRFADTVLTEEFVDAFVDNNGYMTSFTELDPTVNSLGTSDLTGCSINEVPKSDGAGGWVCASADTGAGIDTLGALTSCGDGAVAKWDQASSTWLCGVDINTDDTVLTEEFVDAFVDNNGYMTSFTELDPTVNSLGTSDLTGCSINEVPKSDGAGGWVCASDDTGAGIDTLGALTGCGDGAVAKWHQASSTWLCGVDIDTADTVLSQEQVDTYTDNNGYLSSEADPVFAQSVAAVVTAEDISNWDAAFGYGDHSATGYVRSAEINNLATASLYCADGDIPKWSTAAAPIWECVPDEDNSDWDTVTGGINYAGGNLGVGTEAPAAPLDVVGDASISGTLSVGSITVSGSLQPGYDSGWFGCSTTVTNEVVLTHDFGSLPTRVMFYISDTDTGAWARTSPLMSPDNGYMSPENSYFTTTEFRFNMYSGDWLIYCGLYNLCPPLSVSTKQGFCRVLLWK